MSAPAVTRLLIFSLLAVLLFPVGYVSGDCTCDSEDASHDPNHVTLKYKIGAFVGILVAGAIGVSLPILGKSVPAFRPESNLFFLVKAFAAGVILSTGFIHILPDAFEDLTNPCLKDPWQSFPFTGLAAMVGSLGTLMIDAFATGHYTRAHFGKNNVAGAGAEGRKVSVDEEMNDNHVGHVHLHTHATHGHAHGAITASPLVEGSTEFERIRYRITSQVLELGIIVHSVIIGISMGTSQSLSTIKPLMAALCFHQCFEGMGLGGCIAQADFKSISTLCMGLFFSLTTPIGIAIGIGIMSTYDDNSPVALIVQGLLNSCASGILIYMALVDLLAQDFMSLKLQSSKRLFLGTNVALLLGAGLMAVLAIWA